MRVTYSGCVIMLYRDKTMVNKHLLTVLVRLFLEKNESVILKFVSDFAKLTVSDEKVEFFSLTYG